MGAHPSRGLLFRWEDSGAEEEQDDEEAEATTAATAGSGSRQLMEPEGGEVSGPTAPCSTSPAAACSASRVGDEGGEARDFFLLEDNSFRRLFFSFCDNKRHEFVKELQQLQGPWDSKVSGAGCFFTTGTHKCAKNSCSTHIF